MKSFNVSTAKRLNFGVFTPMRLCPQKNYYWYIFFVFCGQKEITLTVISFSIYEKETVSLFMYTCEETQESIINNQVTSDSNNQWMVLTDMEEDQLNIVLLWCLPKV